MAEHLIFKIVSLTRMARESGHTTFPELFLVPTLAATRHWRCLPPGLKLPCQPTWNRFSSRRNTSQADVSVKSGPDYQTFSSLASIKSCLSDSKTKITSFYPYIMIHSRSWTLESVYDYFPNFKYWRVIHPHSLFEIHIYPTLQVFQWYLCNICSYFMYILDR